MHSAGNVVYRYPRTREMRRLRARGGGAVRRHPYLGYTAPLVPGWLLFLGAVCFALLILR